MYGLGGHNDGTSREGLQGVVTLDAVAVKSHAAIHRTDVASYPSTDTTAFNIDESELLFTYEGGGTGKLPVAFAVLNGAPINAKIIPLGVSMTKHLVGDPTTVQMTVAGQGMFTITTRGLHSLQRYDIAEFYLPELLDEKRGGVAGQSSVDQGRIYPLIRPMNHSSSDPDMAISHKVEKIMLEWKQHVSAAADKILYGTKEERVQKVIKDWVQSQYTQAPKFWETVNFLNDAEKAGKAGSVGEYLTDNVAMDLYKLCKQTEKTTDLNAFFYQVQALIEYVNIWLTDKSHAKLIDPDVGYTLLHDDLVRLVAKSTAWATSDFRGKGAACALGLVLKPCQAHGKTSLFVHKGTLSS